MRALEETIQEKHAALASKTDIRELELKLEMKIEQSKADIIKWVVGLILAQTALLAGLIKPFA